MYHYAANNPVRYTDPDGEAHGIPYEVQKILDDRQSSPTTFDKFRESVVNLAGEIKDSVVEKATSAYIKITYRHFEGRDNKNKITETYSEIKESAENGGSWTLLDKNMSIYHQNGIGFDELKFINEDGREAVFTKDFSTNGDYQLYLDPKYKGTYNYCNPAPIPNEKKDIKGWGKFALKAVGHFFVDILPYYLTGFKNERDQ